MSQASKQEMIMDLPAMAREARENNSTPYTLLSAFTDQLVAATRDEVKDVMAAIVDGNEGTDMILNRLQRVVSSLTDAQRNYL